MNVENSTVILRAANLKKSYQTKAEKIEVLRGVNLDIHTGEIVAVMGPSGAGKSTLLHILGLIDVCDEGQLVYNGTAITPDTDLAAIRAQQLGFVFQYHHLLPEFTVMENLLIPQSLIHREDRTAARRAVELLHFLGLEARADHYPSQISGGEKQRVALLRALVNSPGIVLADEPTGNLDLENSRKLLDFIIRLRDTYQHSFLVATHDEAVADVADRVLFIDSGKLNEEN